MSSPQLNWYHRNHNRIHNKLLIKYAKVRAKRKHLPFSLTEKDITIPEVCPVLGIPIKHCNNGFCGASPSIDRMKPELGYVPGNVKVISNRANSLKRDATIIELRAILKYMEQND